MGPASNLHNAASYARRALGDRDAVVLRGGVVELAPAAEVSTDVERFERGEDSAHGGEPLPTSP
jgi:DNA-binding SARP family transcriptional activator